MAIFLLIFSWILFFLILNKFSDSKKHAFLLASVVFGVTVTGTIELLSIRNNITYFSLVILWISYLLTLSFYWFFSKKSILSKSSVQFLIFNLKDQIKSIFNTTIFWRLTIFSIIFICLTTFLAAIFFPPNSGDVLSYHMSRVMHWTQNKSIAFYPTSIMRQDTQPPFSEYIFLTSYILGGGDYFVNLLSWFCMLGSLVALWLLGFELTGNKKVAQLSVVLGAVIPAGILQASGAKNDYVVTFWITTFMYFTLRICKKAQKIDVCAAGASLGLALLTKGTGYLYLFPIIVIYGVLLIRSIGVQSLLYFFMIAFIALSINFGHYSRNYSIFQSPLGPDREDIEDNCCNLKYANDIFTLPSFISSVSRNIAIEIATPIKSVNRIIYDSVIIIHKIIKIDPSDKRLTWDSLKFAVVMVFDESGTNNPIFFSIAVACLTIVLVHRNAKTFKNHSLMTYSIVVISGFLVFCVYLKWQSGYSRYHLPFLVLATPIMAIVLYQMKKKIRYGLIILLISTALPYSIYNSNRPLFSLWWLTQTRVQRFNSNTSLLDQSYRQAALLINQQTDACNQIGLFLGRDDMEYLFWVYLQSNGKSYELHHVGVRNPTNKLTVSSQIPCILITSRSNESQIYIEGKGYRLISKTNEWKPDYLNVYVPEVY